MGTARLGTPPKEGIATPPRSIERNKISTGTPKTQLKRNKTQTKVRSESFKAISKELVMSSDDALIKTDEILWSRRAESTSSQESSGVSSASGSTPPLEFNSAAACTCSSFVTVNGQHHCVIEFDGSESVQVPKNRIEIRETDFLEEDDPAADTLETASSSTNCDMHTAIVVNL